MITEIKWNNHPILGNLTLNLTKSSGEPYKTIIIVGENGTGKTTILESLSTFLNLGSMSPFEYIKYEVDGESYTTIPDKDTHNLGFHTRIRDANNAHTIVRTNRNNNVQLLNTDKLDI